MEEQKLRTLLESMTLTEKSGSLYRCRAIC